MRTSSINFLNFILNIKKMAKTSEINYIVAESLWEVVEMPSLG